MSLLNPDSLAAGGDQALHRAAECRVGEVLKLFPAQIDCMHVFGYLNLLLPCNSWTKLYPKLLNDVIIFGQNYVFNYI
jgi:hypothetical protein